MILRRYVGKRLAEYYAQPSHQVVGTPPTGEIDFASLLGEWHWRRVYRSAYEGQEGQWLTPVELFRPYYSRCLANFIAYASRHNGETFPGRLHVVELGGGRGTNANLILSHLRQNYADVYDNVDYTIFDSSPTLHRLQEEAVSAGEHGDKVNLSLEDMADIAENKSPFLSESSTPTIVIGMELLDNLPHDKVSRCKKTRSLQQAELRPAEPPCSTDRSTSSQSSLTRHPQHAETRTEADNELVEIFTPMADPLLKSVVEDVPSYAGLGRAKWVPTVACGMIRRLYQSRPNAHILFADFDYLPPGDIGHSPSPRRSMEADGEPIITSMDGVDHECYLDCPPFCDILFPTDFAKLAAYVRKQIGKGSLDVQVRKQAEFLQEYGAEEVRQTKSWLTGYSPLVHDFGNCSVLTVSRSKHPLLF